MSDTHNNLKNVSRIVELFNGAGLDRIVHTGDITQAKTLEILARLDAPLIGVYGNNDQERASLDEAAAHYGIELAEPPLELTWSERNLIVVHDPRDLETRLGPEQHLALHGHTHLHVHEERQGSLVFNPGECAGHLAGHNAIGIVDLTTLAVERLLF